jgi:hypothetical protein
VSLTAHADDLTRFEKFFLVLEFTHLSARTASTQFELLRESSTTSHVFCANDRKNIITINHFFATITVYCVCLCKSRRRHGLTTAHVVIALDRCVLWCALNPRSNFSFDIAVFIAREGKKNKLSSTSSHTDDWRVITKYN